MHNYRRLETKKALNHEGFYVIPERLERSTHSLEGCCSIQLSYGTKISNCPTHPGMLYCSIGTEQRNLFPAAKLHYFSVYTTVFSIDILFSR
jgi:hypothetical protein